jgi:hypothetical protein
MSTNITRQDSNRRPANMPPTPRRPRRQETALARVSVFFGIQSILLGAILLIPIVAIVTGTIALSRGTLLPGRAIAGIVLGATFLPPWAGFVALCIWSYTRSRY